MDLLDLRGKVVIVTGASSGIGEATARLLHADGAHPVLAARRADRLERLSRSLGGALALETDVTDPRAVRRLVDATIERFGTIDGLVNNAGAALHTPLDQLDLEEFARVLDLNVVSVVALMQAVLPAMRAQRSGRIVNVGSGTTRSPRRGSAPTRRPSRPSTCSRRWLARSSKTTASSSRWCHRRSRRASSPAGR